MKRIYLDDMDKEAYIDSQKNQYVQSQKNSNIAVGNLVTVTRAAYDYEKGWKNAWSESMDSFIGKTYTVIVLNGTYGITLMDAHTRDSFDFPYFVLSKLATTHSRVTISVKDISCVIEIPNEMLTAIEEKEKVIITNVTFK